MLRLWNPGTSGDRGGTWFLSVLAALAVAVPFFNQVVPASSSLHLSVFGVTLIGKYLCYGMLALAIDLIWGYCGILSLGHAAFFSLGGYAMGMYLMRQIGSRGVYGDPILPDFMVFLNYKSLPLVLVRIQSLPLCARHDVLGARAARLRVRLVRLPLARDRRVLFHHHAGAHLRLDAGVLPQRHGLRRQQRLHRFQRHPGVRPAFGPHPRGAAGDHRHRARRQLPGLPRHRRIASRTRHAAPSAMPRAARVFWVIPSNPIKLWLFVFSAIVAGVAGALYVPQIGIINPSEFSPINSIEAVIWVAVGGRGTLYGAIAGAVLVNYAKTYLTGAFPEVWLYALGALFVLVTVFLPRGIIGLVQSRDKNIMSPRQEALSGGSDRQLRRLQGAQRAHSVRRSRRNAVHHRPQRRRQNHHDGRHHR